MTAFSYNADGSVDLHLSNLTFNQAAAIAKAVAATGAVASAHPDNPAHVKTAVDTMQEAAEEMRKVHRALYTSGDPDAFPRWVSHFQPPLPPTPDFQA